MLEEDIGIGFFLFNGLIMFIWFAPFLHFVYDFPIANAIGTAALLSLVCGLLGIPALMLNTMAMIIGGIFTFFYILMFLMP